MKTLKEIKKYLKEQETKTFTSRRGNTYEVAEVDKKIIDKVESFSTLIKSYFKVNNKKITSISWMENGRITNVLVIEKEVK